MNEEWRFHAHELIRNQTEMLVKSIGGEVDLKIDVGYPFVNNNKALSAAARKLAEEFAGGKKCNRNRIANGVQKILLIILRLYLLVFLD